MNFSENIMNIISKPTKLAIPALVMSTVVFSQAQAGTQLLDLSADQTAENRTELRFSFAGQPVAPSIRPIKNRVFLDFPTVSSTLPQQEKRMMVGAIKSSQLSLVGADTQVMLNLQSKINQASYYIDGNDVVLVIDSPLSAQNIASTKPVKNTSSVINTSITRVPMDTQTSNAQSMVNTSITRTPFSKSTNVAYNQSAENIGFYGSDEGLTDLDLVPANDLMQPNNQINNAPSILPRQQPTAVSVYPAGVAGRKNPLLATYIGNNNYDYNGLTAVNFSGGASGGNVSITLTDESIPVDVQRQGNSIVMRMNGSTVPQDLVRRMSVNNPLVNSISASNKGKNGSVRIDMNGDFEYQAYQSGNQLNISLTPPQMLTEPTLEEKVYTGEPISLQFQKVEVRNILQMLADFTDMNIVVGDSVNGNITLRLINVPWDQALDIILDSKNLDKRVNGNTITVAPSAELAKKEADALKVLQEQRDLQPLRTEYIRLSYSKVGDIIKLISQGKGSNSKNSDDSGLNDTGSLLSKRGTVTSDERTNTLIVKDTSQSIENIRALIAKIDIPVKQVMVEARIVSANDNFSKELGVKWGILSNGAATNNDLLVGGSNETLWNLKQFDVESTEVNGQTVNYPSYDISRPGNLNVDLGVSNPAGRIAFGLLSMSDMMLDLELSAMQADNRGEVISTPKVLTADKQTAKVTSGTQLPYLEASASGATSVSFVEAALSLQVTPNITPEGKIGLELDVSNDSPTQLSTGQYAVDTNQINTNVVVEDGQTVVLGGIFKNTLSNGQTKVPFLGDLPYVGKLFRNDIRSNKKEELLIFVTPKLVHDGSNSF